MFKIRYYAQTFEPKEFGRLIRFLNWTRYWLETLVQYLVLRHFLRMNQLTKEEKKSALDTFRVDVKAEVEQWKNSDSIESSILEMVSHSTSKQDDVRPKPLDMDRYLIGGREKRFAQRRLARVPEDVEESTEPESPPVELPNVEVDDH